MATLAYDFGDTAVLSVTFTVAGVATDPTDISARVRKPDGSTVDYAAGEISHDGTGSYHLDVACDQAGDWTWKFVGTGAAADVDTGAFYVKPDPTGPIGRDLCTIADVLAYVPGYRSDDETDAQLQQLISSESQLLQREANREIVAILSQNPRRFDVDWLVWESRELDIGDASEITTVSVLDWNDTVVDTPMSYVELPRIRDEWEPITSLWFRPTIAARTSIAQGYVIEIDAVWGFPQIPAFIVKACAARVLLRYITDVASKGTSFADAIDNVNLAALFASSRDAINAIGIPSLE